MAKWTENKIETKEDTKPTTVKIAYLKNAKYELHVDGEVYTFWGQETMEVPATILSSPDFHDDIKKQFIIKG